TTAAAAFSVASADLDGDQDIDVLSASERDDTVAWYENDGATFTAHIITTMASGARSIASADLDGDQDLDVLSASFTDNTVAWYENDGAASPTFTPHVITRAALGAWTVACADLDGDQDIDVLSASYWDNTVAWYENDGNASTFTPHAITTTAAAAFSVASADLDGDQDIDVLSAS
ncbi:MAG: VCBS repeat-containing protein, partial [Planctomycetota bacterium]